MAPLFSVAKFLAKTRSRSKRSSSDSATLAGDNQSVEKIPLPVPSLPAAAEAVRAIIPEPVAEPSAPLLDSRSHSDAVSSVPTEAFKTPAEERQGDTSRPLSWLGESNTLVHEPEGSTQDVSSVPAPPLAEVEAARAVTGEEKTTEVAPPSAPAVEVPVPVEEATKTEEAKLEVVNEKEAVRVFDEEMKSLLEQEIVNQKADIDVLSQAKVALQDDLQRYQTDLSAAKQEKEGLSVHTRRVEEELRNALNVVDTKTDVVDRLIAEVGHLKDEIMVLVQEREEASRMAEREKEFMEERFEAEKEQIRRAGELDKEHSKREVHRLKGIIAVERHMHKEHTKDFIQEKEDLASKVGTHKSHIDSLTSQIEVQQDRITGLEVRLEDSREETRELYQKLHEQETRIKRLDDELLEERDKTVMKDSQIHFLETSNESTTTALVNYQSKSNETERLNEMLMEQLRQQADQLQSRGGYPDSLGAGIGRLVSRPTLNTFSSFTRGLRRGANTARAEAGVKALKLLNDEIFQVAASLTDQLEGVNKRSVNDDSLPSFSYPPASELSQLRHEAGGVRLAKAEYLKATLGSELISRLQKDAPQEMEDTNPFFLQVALQGCLTACCMQIITSWYPTEWEYGRFLEALYERIRGAVGLDIALNWRKTTQQNIAPSIPRDRNTKLVQYLVDDLRTVLTVSGWSKDSEADATIESFRQKLFNVVSMAIRMNTLTAVGVPGELEPVLTERGNLFDPRIMVDDSSPERSRSSEAVPKEEVVIAVAGLGLKWADQSDVDMPHLLLKPRVLLDSALC